MALIKTSEEIKILKEGGKILHAVLNEVVKNVVPGVSTKKLDDLAEKLIKEKGGKPSFKNYKTEDDRIPYPASICVSINDEIVHGIPAKEKILKEGDIVGLDLGMEYKKMFTDMAVTVPVGKVSVEAQKLINTCRISLEKGIRAVRAGSKIGDIGFAVQSYAENKGFGVVRKLVGHGVGHKVHEDPEVPNFGKKGAGLRLEIGMILAIEPMITSGDHEIALKNDLWTWKTKDGSLSAHFEHTVAVTKNGAEILTA